MQALFFIIGLIVAVITFYLYLRNIKKTYPNDPVDENDIAMAIFIGLVAGVVWPLTIVLTIFYLVILRPIINYVNNRNFKDY